MSQRHKLSLWQKIKQLLTTSRVQPAISDIEISTSLPVKTFNHENNNEINHLPLETDNKSVDSKNADNQYGKVNNSNAINNSIETETGIGSNFDNIVEQEITEQNDTEHMPIVDYLKHYFDDKGWHYNHYQPRKNANKGNNSQQSHHLSLRMINKQLDCGYLFRVQEANDLLAVYGILPFLIPESHQSAAMLLITQINYDMLIGNLEMDIDDGEIRYKNAIDVEAVGIDDHIIEHLLQSVIAMTTVAYEIFSDLIKNHNPAEALPELLIQLRQQVDSRTFYLPTQFVQ